MMLSSIRDIEPKRWRAVLAAVVIVGSLVLGPLVGWRLAGMSSTETEVGRVAFTIHPSLGGNVSAFVPLADWGLEANAIDGPFELRAELRTLDRDAVQRAAEGDTLILDETREQVADGAVDAILRATGFALACTMILIFGGLLLIRAQPRLPLLGVGTALAVLASAATVALAQWTFDEDAFENPTYFARGAELGRIVDIASGQPLSSDYGQTLARVLRSVSLVLDTPDDAAEPPGREIFAASDLHANPLVVAPVSEFVRGAPLLLAGDFGQRGGELEARAIAPQVANLGERLVAVSGNHDTTRLMEAFESEGVEVLGLDGGALETVMVDGLRVAGFPDPLEWEGPGDPEDRPITFDDLKEPEAAMRAFADQLITAFQETSPPPDIVMVHQNSLARALAEYLYERDYDRPLTIVTGHDHRQRVERFGSIVIVDGGTLGAGGAFDTGEAAAGFARLLFSAETPQLRAVDLLATEPLSENASAFHLSIPGLCDGEPVCSVEPPGTGSNPPGD